MNYQHEHKQQDDQSYDQLPFWSNLGAFWTSTGNVVIFERRVDFMRRHNVTFIVGICPHH